MSERDNTLSPVAGLLRGAVTLDDRERAVARADFLRRVDARSAPAKASVLFRYGAPLALAAAVLLGLALWRTSGNLEYTVEGASNEAGYVQASEERPVRLVFTDKTVIAADAGTRLRVDNRTGQHGAHVVLERGRLDAQVAHTGRSDWHFVAGPFTVRVTGTHFTLQWDASSERLQLELLEGSVTIQGYAGTGSVDVRGGQRFLGDARNRTMAVSELSAPDEALAPDPLPAAPSTETLAPAPAAELPTRSPVPSTAPGSLPHPTWSELITKGDFHRVVEEANARGTHRCLESCGAADLSALADAARYVGQASLAEQALMALRTRHGQTHGVRAAFLLGRLHEGRGDFAKARSWYETTLRDGGVSSFSPEALAGKMRATAVLEGRVAARPVAQEYLRLYPSGVHAARAHQILDGP